MSTSLANSLQIVNERIARSAIQSASADLHKLTFHAMGTICRVHFQAKNPEAAHEFQSEVLAWVAQFEAKYSRFIPDSLIGRINAAAGEHWVDIDPETEGLLKLCRKGS